MGENHEFLIRHITMESDQEEPFYDTLHPEYFGMVILLKGELKRSIDFKEYKAVAPALITIRPGQVYLENGPPVPADYYAIGFRMEFIDAFVADPDWKHPFNRASLVSVEQFDRSVVDLLRILLNMEKEGEISRSVRAYLLLALLEKTDQLCARSSFDAESRRYDRILQQFTLSIEQYFATKTQVNQYAELLHVSSGHLNEVVKALRGKNAKSLIDERRALEAKRLLYRTDQPIRDIAMILGFEDQTYFTKFFKKMSGELPLAFQKKSPYNFHKQP